MPVLYRRCHFLCTLAAVALLVASVDRAHAAYITGVCATTTMGSGGGTLLSNTVNANGLSAASLTATHAGTIPTNSWISSTGTTGMVTFNLNGLYTVDSFSFWNQNGGGPGASGTTGIKNLQVQISNDGIGFSALTGGPTIFAQVPGSTALAPETFTFPPVSATHIRFVITSNHGDPANTGFAEVAFNSTAGPGATPMPCAGAPAGVTITQSAGATNVAEGGVTDTYTVVLNKAPTANVTITLNAGTQLTVAPAAPLVFTVANWNVPQTVTVTAVDDVLIEGPHTGTITHTATSADVAYNGIAISSVVANITDNDLPVPPVPGPGPTPPPAGTPEGSFAGSTGGQPAAGEGFFGFGLSMRAADWNPTTPLLRGPCVPLPCCGGTTVISLPPGPPTGADLLVFNVSNNRQRLVVSNPPPVSSTGYVIMPAWAGIVEPAPSGPAVPAYVSIIAMVSLGSMGLVLIVKLGYGFAS